MKLSIIIVSYNVKDLLKQAIDSLFVASATIDTEFFVVDNASKDGTVDFVKQAYPTINLIANTKNLGFSVANNQALSRAKGEYVLVINPDTITQPNTLLKAIDFLDSHADAGSLGVRILDGNGKFLPESKRGLPTPWVSFCKLSGLYRLFPKSKMFNRYYMGWVNEFKTQEVAVLTGAFMLLRKNVLEKIGLFDEHFFMYGEDVDLSYRLTLAGYKNYYFPEVYITHFKGQSTHKLSVRYIKSFYGSMFIFAKKYFLKF
ncbi:glycosyltransferase family 2 protein [Pedobacter arcticus]|uniref:glycosyltransferase family 2 protein n=1 Tax=Pedobacter arcticus TaxID=752140 RepID=UPI00031D0BC9|nr:glycosyltransferase family 2 protein [Pedobacter arcticus]